MINSSFKCVTSCVILRFVFMENWDEVVEEQKYSDTSMNFPQNILPKISLPQKCPRPSSAQHHYSYVLILFITFLYCVREGVKANLISRQELEEVRHRKRWERTFFHADEDDARPLKKY